MSIKRSIGSTARWTLGVSLLGLISGTTIGAPVEDGAGNPGDTYYIPPGYFAPGVPAVGTVEQQEMMAEAVEAMWALGDALRQEVIDFGDQAVIDLDALIASGAEPWDVYDAAVELEQDIDDLALANQLTIADSVVPIFGDVENSLPAPPTELLTAAFGPTLTSISLLWVEVDYYVMEFQSRRSETRPDEPAPPVVVAAAPEVVFEPEAPQAQSAPSVASAEADSSSGADQPSTVYVSPHERKRLAKLEKQRQRQAEKERKRELKEERKRQKQLEKQRKKELKAERKRQKQIEKQQKRAARLEAKRAKQEAKRLQKLQRQQRKARGE